MPVIIGMTKCDQLPKHARKPVADKLAAALATALGTSPAVERRRIVLVTATTGDGIDELWRRIATLLTPADRA